MTSPRRDDDGAEDPPFLLRLFYRNGSLVKPDDFTRHEFPTTHVDVYARLSTTLADLTLELASAAPHALPEIASGTRFVYQLVYPSPPSAHPSHSTSRGNHGHANSRARYMVEDLGSVVIGGGSEEGDVQSYAPSHNDHDGPRGRLSPAPAPDADRKEERTLGEARFVVGDYIVVAVLPTAEDGSVAPAEAAKKEIKDRGGPGGFRESGGGFGVGRRGGRGGGTRRGGSAGVIPPMGDWRRGEPLPDTREWKRQRRAW